MTDGKAAEISAHRMAEIAPLRGKMIFLTICMAVVMSVLDGSMLNIALPAIAREHGISASSAINVVTFYQLAIVVCLLPLGVLGEIIGFKRVFVGGILIILLGSVACAVSPDIGTLSFARAFQGIGAGAVMSVNAALLRHVVPSRNLGKSISGISIVVGISAAAGPSLGSAILALGSWHWLFIINIPVGMVILIFALVLLPETPAGSARFDYMGAVLNGLAMGLLITGLGSFGKERSLPAILELTGAFIAGSLLVRRELGRASPMLPLDLLALPSFARSIAASVLAFTAQFLALVSLPFLLHDTLGFSGMKTGLLMTMWPFAGAFTAFFAGRISDRFRPEILTAPGMALAGTALLGAGLVFDLANEVAVALCLIGCGIGFGFFQSPNNRMIITSAPRHRAGSAGAMQSMARLTGQSFGAALAGVLVAMSGGSGHVPVTVASAFAFASALVSLINKKAL